jgi:CheY-like chemotaxis protein
MFQEKSLAFPERNKMARILVIEDNPANLDLMIYLLDAFGHTPLAATDGEVGIALIQNETPHLIICDIQLPKLSGYEVVQWLKQEPALSDIPILAVTAYAMVGDRDKVLAAGFDGYLTKPIQPETFVPQVESFLNDITSGSLL